MRQPACADPVIDPADDALSTIPFHGKGEGRGIAACGGKLYCAPQKSNRVLVIDPSKADIQHHPGRLLGDARRWCAGIAACEGKLYCAPFDADAILVIDSADDDTWRIMDCGVRGNGK